jgi:hypothetical protein
MMALSGVRSSWLMTWKLAEQADRVRLSGLLRARRERPRDRRAAK